MYIVKYIKHIRTIVLHYRLLTSQKATYNMSEEIKMSRA